MNPTYARVARQALEVADYVFFVGPWASRSLRAKRYADDHALQAFVTIDHINGFLHGFLEPGDLVLIKGSSRTDHLSRIVSAWNHKPQGRSGKVHPDRRQFGYADGRERCSHSFDRWRDDGQRGQPTRYGA